MGIQGLLPLLKTIQKPVHLRHFEGQRLGIDAYGWLHRGTVACPIPLALGQPTRKHIDFALNRVRMLMHFGVKPYLVFDGDNLPSKAGTEAERRERREESRKLGLELLSMGRPDHAYQELQKAIDVTPTMARQMIEDLKLLNVDYVVAPYEADSQLVYLEQKGVISGIVSEDSDMLVFGAKCLVTKLDQYGDCITINRDDFTKCLEVSFLGWQLADFRHMAILSGCDYLPGIAGLGPKTAHRLLRKHKTYQRAIRALQFDGKKKVPAGYLEDFVKAERTFLYQWVYCPEAKELVNLNPVPADLNLDDMPYIGQPTESQLATAIATGEIDPHTKRAIILETSSDLPPAMHTPIERTGKPITDFFKPMSSQTKRNTRVVLGELDPNSLTPSPSQQRLLQAQQNTTWSATRVNPVNTISSRMTGSQSAPRPLGGRTGSLDTRPDSLSRSIRERLCSDAGMDALRTQVATAEASTKSRFFDQASPASPSTRKAPSTKKTEEFELWSDDSVAEAAANVCSQVETEVAKVEPPSKKRKKFTIYADTPQSPACGSTDTDTQGSANSNTSAETTTSISTSSSDVDGASSATSLSFSQGIESDYALFRSKHAPFNSKWAFAPSADSQKDVDKGSGQSEEQDPSAALQVTAVLCSSPPSSNSNLEDGQGRTKVAVAGQDGSVGKEKDKSSPRPALVGSEDLLVPESPPPSSKEEQQPGPRVLNLARFAYAG